MGQTGKPTQPVYQAHAGEPPRGAGRPTQRDTRSRPQELQRVPSRHVCQQARQGGGEGGEGGEGASKENIGKGSVLDMPSPSARAVRQRRLTAWPPANP